MKTVTFHPLALIEYIHAIDYLMQYRREAGTRLRPTIDATIERALNQPLGGRPTFAGCRLYEVPRFKYNVIYKVRASDLWIIALAHMKRKPGYWTGRVE